MFQKFKLGRIDNDESLLITLYKEAKKILKDLLLKCEPFIEKARWLGWETLSKLKNDFELERLISVYKEKGMYVYIYLTLACHYVSIDIK